MNKHSCSCPLTLIHDFKDTIKLVAKLLMKNLQPFYEFKVCKLAITNNIFRRMLKYESIFMRLSSTNNTLF